VTAVYFDMNVDYIGDAKNARHEFAGHENAAPCEKSASMEHRVLHMSVHCRAGMHE